MKTSPMARFLHFVTLFLAASLVSHPATGAPPADRVSFMLKNTSGAHRMFRVEGPGIAYGFTMNRREMIPCHWPIGANLYFSSDGETKEGLILTVKAADQGQTLLTGTTHTPQKTPVSPFGVVPFSRTLYL